MKNDTVSGAEALVEMLAANGVQYIFGLCGDTSLPFYDALHRLDHGMQHVLARDERSAGYMAEAYAKVSGKVGVCEGPSGGGATYLLPGLVEANESSVPVLGITSDVPVTSRDRYPLTELDQQRLYGPLTKWNGTADLPSQIPSLVRHAFRSMTTGRSGATHLCMPYDVQKQSLEASSIWAQPGHDRAPAYRSVPAREEIELAAELLRNARSPVLICGGGVLASEGTAELAALAEILQAPVCTTVTGKGTIADSHKLAAGVVGANGGTLETRAVVQAADLVMFIGCRAGSTTTENWRVPSREVPIVHLDIDPAVIGANYLVSAALVGDAKASLAELCRILARHHAPEGGASRNRASEARNAKRKRLADLSVGDDKPIRPEAILSALNRTSPAETIVVADPGTPCPYVSCYFEIRQAGRYFLTNRAHGALGYSLSAAIGAWYARPDSKVVAIMGDGSFGFTAGELETVARLRIPLVIIVLANSTFGWIKASQKAGYDERYFSVDFSQTDHARIAEAYAIEAHKIVHPADLEIRMRAAFEADHPVLLDIATQPLQEAAAPVSQWMG
ncbi:thiamine pyrophosphate-binding protein [Ensifer adhaerens]|uniref:thiamine pyrophosphate-binding protein n=1 Tax=Ensifer adhaerens TaxID=106592 RepID=UPI0023A9DE7D|nr:thiamine pyrophosphate-binding protein [Ensifer adhaerens]WDZ76221.1 thiamine pyrophosphate-binding protein [Ensifer adhaerens]